MSTLNNLAITTTNRLMTSATGKLFDFLQSFLANGGRDTNCKFYYNNGAGGSILQVVAKSVVGGAVADLKDVAYNHFNSWLNGKKEPKQLGKTWVDAGVKMKEAEEAAYGKMKVNDDKNTIYALDDWGCVCPDALMLGIKVDTPVHITQSFPNFRAGADGGKDVTGKGNESNSILNDIPESDTLVWYDTTALVTINSDKNIVATRVAGRDYSRKELVSNGDIRARSLKFSGRQMWGFRIFKWVRNILVTFFVNYEIAFSVIFWQEIRCDNLKVSEICCNFVDYLIIGDKIMARPIAETPILTGDDAVRFEKLRMEVESLSKEQRAENTRKLKEAVKKAKEYITICI